MSFKLKGAIVYGILTNMKIPVVIFCGGRGTRMKEETEFRPKPMVTLGDQPILWHIMKTYAHYGYNDFIIALGYKGDYIKYYFINQKHVAHNFTLYTRTGYSRIHRDENDGKRVDDFKITFVDTGVETKTAERLLRVKEYIKSDLFMVTYGDGVSNINIKNLVQYHQDKKVIGVLTGVHPRSKWGLVVADKNKIVKEFREKPVLNEYVNGGFMIFTRDFFKYLKVDEMIEVSLERLGKDKQLAVYHHDGYWSAIDTYQDLETMNEQWKRNPLWRVWK